MADYSSPLSNPLDLADLNTALQNDLPLLLTSNVDNTDYTTSSTSFVNLITANITAKTDDFVIAFGQVSFSHDTATEEVAFRFLIDGVSKTPQPVWYIETGSTNKRGYYAMLMAFAGTLSGSVDVDLQWGVNTGTGTIYSNEQSIHVFQLKQRS